MKILVTGMTGFVGRQLTPRLAADGHDLLGIGFDGPESDLPKQTPADSSQIDVVQLDLVAGRGLFELFQDFKPDAVMHLAAQSAPGLSHSDPIGTFRSNVDGTLNLLEAIRRCETYPRMLFVSSSEVYGLAGDAAIAESAPMRPVNPYGASKAAAEILVGQYARSWRLPAVIVRSFPHAGPGQRPLFALPAFARQVARIEAGRQEAKLSVGNLDARRDYLDVADVADAYARLIELGEPGETYNLCSGETHSIREGLDLLLSLAKREIEVVSDSDLFRPLDLPVLLGDNAKIRRLTNWAPTRSFPEIVETVLEDWRRRVSEEEAA